jgi:hypothetical protein
MTTNNLVLWHRTTVENATLILRGGFRDARGRYMTDREFIGVWLSSRPLDANEGAWGECLLRVELDCSEDAIKDFEWIEEGKGYREWLLPAAFLKTHASVVIVQDDGDYRREQVTTP